jgi:hypothetical protein
VEGGEDKLWEWKGSVEWRMWQLVAKVKKDTVDELQPPDAVHRGHLHVPHRGPASSATRAVGPKWSA